MARRVLIVDDSGVGRKLVRRCLEFAGLAGATFLEADNGQAALDILEREGADLIVTDLNMPVMDGIELLRAMAEVPSCKATVRIVMTSTASPRLRAELEQYGVAALIAKPVSPTDVAKVVAPLLIDQAPA